MQLVQYTRCDIAYSDGLGCCLQLSKKYREVVISSWSHCREVQMLLQLYMLCASLHLSEKLFSCRDMDAQQLSTSAHSCRFIVSGECPLELCSVALHYHGVTISVGLLVMAMTAAMGPYSWQ